MPNPVFDRLPSIFVDKLGEPVIYTPVSTGIPATIRAIWADMPLDVLLGGGTSEDASRTTLSVRFADVIPQEGDTATRVADGKVMTVATPIRPDGKGMIDCNLVDADEVVPGYVPSLDFTDPRNSGYLILLEDI